jgi:hypothetical protein
MQRRWSKPLYHSFILVLVLCSGVMLSGCDILDFLGTFSALRMGTKRGPNKMASLKHF